MMSNLPIRFDTLTREHPQLTEKSLVDFVNGLEVIDDHIRIQENVNSKFITRIWNALNGKDLERNRIVHQNMSESLKTVSTWLQCLQNQKIQSDLAITKIASKLLETREGLMLLLEKHNDLQNELEKILMSVDGIKEKFSQLSIRLEHVNCGLLATQHIESVFAKWEAGHLNHYPVLVRLFLAFDELYWGDFGNYCRQGGLQTREIQRLIQQVQDKSLVQLKKDWLNSQLSPIAYAWQADTKHYLQNLQDEHRQVIAYLTDKAKSDSMPMLWSLNQLANDPSRGDLLQSANLPIVLNAQNAINRFSFDFEVRYTHEYI